MADFPGEEFAGPDLTEAPATSFPAAELFASGGDSAPPVISYLTAPGEIAVDAIVPITVTDDVGVTTLLITAQFPTGEWDVVYDGVSFAARYAASAITPIAGGFQYDIDAGEWRAAPTFRTWAIDAAGNAAQDDAVYTLPAVPVPVPVPVVVTQDQILATEGLRLAVMLSLFTDRRAAESDELPAGDGDRRGWWADEFATVPGDLIGSHLWLLDRSTSAESVAVRAKKFATDALTWLLEDQVASGVDVSVELSNDRIELVINIDRPDVDPAEFRYSQTWDPELDEGKTPWLIM